MKLSNELIRTSVVGLDAVQDVVRQVRALHGEVLFARISHETADWALRDMHSPEGGFYSSLDADSQGHEGKFYVWTPGEVAALLTAQEYAAFSRRFGLSSPANFEGQWHLHTYASVDDIAAALKEPAETVNARIESARAKLLKARNLRIWPARDEKILTSWNALMIKGMVRAARVFERNVKVLGHVQK